MYKIYKNTKTSSNGKHSLEPKVDHLLETALERIKFLEVELNKEQTNHNEAKNVFIKTKVEYDMIKEAYDAKQKIVLTLEKKIAFLIGQLKEKQNQIKELQNENLKLITTLHALSQNEKVNKLKEIRQKAKLNERDFSKEVETIKGKLRYLSEVNYDQTPRQNIIKNKLEEMEARMRELEDDIRNINVTRDY